MKSRILWIVIITALFIVFFLLLMPEETKDESKELARNWVLNESPTYVYDGMNLVFVEESAANGEFICIFSFESRHGGYGDRTGQIVTQVITSHTMEVTVRDGRVVNAVTDEVFNELEGRFLE